jgi:hypothetical protein
MELNAEVPLGENRDVVVSVRGLNIVRLLMEPRWQNPFIVYRRLYFTTHPHQWMQLPWLPLQPCDVVWIVVNVQIPQHIKPGFINRRI